MTEAVNNGAVFTECSFRRAQFNVSVHRDAAVTNCIFSNCSFFDTQFIDCKLIGSTFDRSSYDLMKVASGNWSFVGLSGAIISHEQALMIATTLGLDVRPD